MDKLKCLLLLLLPVLVHGQIICNKAPSAAMRTVCLQLRKWDDSARLQPAAVPRIAVAPPGVGGQLHVAAFLPDTITDPIACNEIACICGLVGGRMTGAAQCRLPSGALYSKGVRKEYRMLSDAERARFHAAMWTLKRNGEYDRFAHIHANVNQAPSAHSGPSFLPWHREYIKRFEIALRLVDPSLALPYWDTTLDGALANAQYSSLWSDELMGSVMSGAVTRGAFRGWTSLTGGTILRYLGRNSTRVLNAADRSLALGKNRIEGILGFINPRRGCPYPIEWDNMEFAHGYSHVWVGGEMFAQHTAAFDPIFFMYHSFVDLMWEDWRVQRQNRASRATAYPPDNAQCSSTAHFGRSTMSPFAPLQNIDGLSNDYTDNLYSFDTRRPSCALGDNCGSKFLFCDRSHGAARCAAKIRLGQPCTGYVNGESVCYNSVCTRGICATPRTPFSITPTMPPPIRPVPTRVPTSETCFNEHECCGPWQARGECRRNPGYMRAWCQASCNICTPRLYSLATECSDRHRACRAWAAGGECARNAYWMTENCRRRVAYLSCNRCGRTRQQTCFPGAFWSLDRLLTRVRNPIPPSLNFPHSLVNSTANRLGSAVAPVHMLARLPNVPGRRDNFTLAAFTRIRNLPTPRPKAVHPVHSQGILLSRKPHVVARGFNETVPAPPHLLLPKMERRVNKNSAREGGQGKAAQEKSGYREEPRRPVFNTN